MLVWIDSWFAARGLVLNVDWVVLNADHTVAAGRGGGLYLIMWDKRVLEKLKDMVGTFSVLVRWQEVAVGFIWVCSRVYGPNENSDKGHMWDELVGIE